MQMNPSLSHTGWGGGLPVALNGTAIGAVAVSGLSSDEDAELAQMGVAAITAAL